MILYTLVLWLSCVAIMAYADLQVVQSWKYLQYLDEDAEGTEEDKSSTVRNIPVDVDVTPDGRMFVTVKRQNGAPSSLNTVSNHPSDEGGLLLTPYPDWSWTSTDSCENIIGVFRVTLDKCNRLWVLDNGSVGNDSTCPPKLMAFDLATDELVRRVDIPIELVNSPNGTGKLATIIVDGDCSTTKAYMADTLGNALLIWNGSKTYRIDSPFFGPDPDAVKYSVSGTDFELERGLLGLSLTQDEPNPTEQKRLYFRPLSSYNLYYTNVIDLNEENYSQNSIQYSTEPTKLTSQSVTQTFSSKGIFFFNSVSNNSILCWNWHRPFIPENIVIVAQDDQTLQWVTSTKIRPSDDGEMLWLMTNRYQQVVTDTLDNDKVNFYVLAGLVDDLVRGTNCE